MERKQRHIKERFRGIVNTLPYRLTEQLESWLLSSLVSNINLVPTWNIFDYVSPREKLLGRRINVDKELKHGFGDYVQVHTSIYTRLYNVSTRAYIKGMTSFSLRILPVDLYCTVSAMPSLAPLPCASQLTDHMTRLHWELSKSTIIYTVYNEGILYFWSEKLHHRYCRQKPI